MAKFLILPPRKEIEMRVKKEEREHIPQGSNWQSRHRGRDGKTRRQQQKKEGARSLSIVAKLFVVDLECHKGSMRGVIEEKRRNLYSWVWMGSFSLGFFLERIERSFLDLKEEQWV